MGTPEVVSERTYRWERYWYERGKGYNASPSGYPYVPGAYNKNVVPFEGIADVPCLVTLGEPGMGKSRALRTEFKELVAAESPGVNALWWDLSLYGSEDRLMRATFESPDYLAWLESGTDLNLFVDSLDECLLSVNNVALLLGHEFKKCPTARIRLRIACRVADWPRQLEKDLKEAWGEGKVKVYNIVPLSEADVTEAATAEGLDADAFRREVALKEVVPLAIKPVTLRLLLDLYREDKGLPSTQAELYERGCLQLCVEVSPTREAARRRSEYPPEQLMAVAARVAAVTVFANRSGIWKGVYGSAASDDDILLSELWGGREVVRGEPFEVSEAIVREALATGLFSTREPDHAVWSHQTYAEFLAAYYFSGHEVPSAQVMSLLVHPGDPDGKLAPQLHEVASWVAGMMPSVFQNLLDSDPDVLLRGEVAAGRRGDLVEALLKLHDEERIREDYEHPPQYRKLCHPRLAEQLRPFIADGSKRETVRGIAIDIATDCKLAEVGNDLADVALDPSEPSALRVKAADAVVAVGDEGARARLKPLAKGEAGADTNDELKACGLEATWPGLLTAEELFEVLTPAAPFEVNLYSHFLSYDLALHLKESDLPAALRWVERQDGRSERYSATDTLVVEIMRLAWEHLDAPGVFDAFAAAVLSLLRERDDIVAPYFDQADVVTFSGDDSERRRVLSAMLSILPNPEDDWVLLVRSRALAVFGRDVPWLIELLRAEQSPGRQRALLELIRRFFLGFAPVEPESLSALHAYVQEGSPQAAALAPLFESVERESVQAMRARDAYRDMRRREARPRSRPPVNPPPAERVAFFLDRFEQGDLAAWWRLNQELTLEPHSAHYGRDDHADLTQLPGWKSADDVTRARIVEAAKKYVLEGDPEASEWVSDIHNHVYQPADAGYRALRLLQQLAPDFVAVLWPEVWAKWVPIIVTFPTVSGGGAATEHSRGQLASTCLMYSLFQHAS